MRDLAVVGFKVADALADGPTLVSAPVNFLIALWKQGRMTMIVAAIIPMNSSVMATVLATVL